MVIKYFVLKKNLIDFINSIKINYIDMSNFFIFVVKTKSLNIKGFLLNIRIIELIGPLNVSALKR